MALDAAEQLDGVASGVQDGSAVAAAAEDAEAAVGDGSAEAGGALEDVGDHLNCAGHGNRLVCGSAS